MAYVSLRQDPVEQSPYAEWTVRVYGLRMAADSALEVPGTTGRSNYYEDFLGFAIGRAVITLHAIGDPRPFPSATEGRLLSLLYSRAEAHKLS